MAATTTASDGKHVSSDWFSVPELRLRDHSFTVPLDYSLDDSTSPKISVFVREVVAVLMDTVLCSGEGRTTPPVFTVLAGWTSTARNRSINTFITIFNVSIKSAAELADYLKHFRADNIVKDAEFIRKRLVPDSSPWTVLGQSYGGFCAVTYLSFAPRGLKQVLLTGGIPPIGSGCTADAVYRACFEQVALPSGGILTPRGLQLLGLSGLGSSTGFERLHYMFERVWDPILVPGAPKRISYFFLNAYERWLAYDTNPLYALMHESIYCQGASSRWSAHRIRAENESQFDAIKAVKEGRPVLFTGEMIFPWLFDEIQALRPFKDAAHLLAEKMDWPPLYDVASLNDNKVPVAAAVYYEDMYVNFKLVMETAAQIAGIRLWVTNEYMHSGLRDGGGQVLDHLLGMLNGKKPLF
ncbi:UNVERIFIED_CONTAM: Proline iminopeptidase [Sesamum latifolium]|uniref:Proline iminopeptidase n=1 Tax=Sesamum latifolium TaxID=2727402 RepID=A0AAW2YGY5_9LAMI